MSIIELSGLRATFAVGSSPIKALDGIELSIEEGSLVAIVGRSGSGKSTLANIIGLLLTPTEGTYRLQGREVGQLALNERARLRSQHIGFIFQKYHLLPRLTALQNVCLPLTYNRKQKLSRRQLLAKAEHHLDRVGLSHRANNRSVTLSGGEQQRVAIARALINDPDIILADEPTGALDSANGAMVTEMLQTLSQRDGMTVLIVTHDAKVASHCPRQIRLNDGRLIDQRDSDSFDADRQYSVFQG
jgi:macrolide transport system ATP-binding/permease protein